ncbi:MAG: O-antigen ligase family protein [Saprospiraceae bacterium]|nr:O-antigen ligase family protein [Saprospiraceae bacterium]
MRQKKKSAPAGPKPASESRPAYHLLIWLALAANSLFLLPWCLDFYLAPRFFFLSGALLLSLYLFRNDLRTHGDWRIHGFDLLLLGWYALNLASVAWAYNISEAIFYSQKVWLLFFTYWLTRQVLSRDPAGVRQAIRQAVILLSYAAGGILIVQIAAAFLQFGSDNERLYDFAKGVSGNKNLASGFLFFLLMLHLLFLQEKGPRQSRAHHRWLAAVLVLLILLLQTRTVYLALAVGALCYVALRAWVEPLFRPVLFKRILPAAIALMALAVAGIAIKGHGNSLAERLNPATYLDSQTANERRFIWYKTDVLNEDHYWWGVGNGSWKIWFPSKSIEGGYRLQSYNVVFTRVHNDYLEVRAELGMIGAVLFCLLFGAAFISAFKSLSRQEAESQERHDLIVWTTALAGYCVIQFFDFPRERIEFQALLAIILAHIAFLSRGWWARLPGLTIPVAARSLCMAVAALLLVFNAIVGWYRIRGEMHNVKLMRGFEKGNYRQVLEEARKAQNPFYEYNEVVLPLSWYEGVAYYQMEQIDRSVEAFSRAYRLNPWSFQVINNYASALVRAGKYEEAITLYEQALAINPRFEDGKFNIAYACVQLKNYGKALEWLDQVDTRAISDDEEAHQRSAALRKRVEETRRAIEEKME